MLNSYYHLIDMPHRYAFVPVLLLLFVSSVLGQTNYYADVQPILYKHCIGCHRPNEIGPFSLLTFDDANKRGSMLAQVTSARYMPPFHADTTFQRYQNERQLSDADIATIADWVATGKRKGRPKNGTEWKTMLADNAVFPQPDFVLKMPDTLYIAANTQDQYRLIVWPLNNDTAIYIRGIELIPTATKQAHHCRIMLDTTHLYRNQHLLAIDSIPDNAQIQTDLADAFFKGWAPGNTATYYPEGAAKRIPPHTDLILNMHYSATATAATDQPEVRLYVSSAPPKKEVKTLVLDERNISNLPFIVPADQVTTFVMRSQPTPFPLIMLTVQPHAHALLRSVRAYIITPAGNLVPLLKINKWDFKWQQTYAFRTPLTLPKGSVIYAEFTYDNTSKNYANPYFPPRTAQFGWRTYDEMCNLIMEYIEE